MVSVFACVKWSTYLLFTTKFTFVLAQLQDRSEMHSCAIDIELQNAHQTWAFKGIHKAVLLRGKSLRAVREVSTPSTHSPVPWYPVPCTRGPCIAVPPNIFPHHVMF